MDKKKLYSSWSSTVSETWRSTYCFNTSIKSLSNSMKIALKESFNNDEKVICKNVTKSSLISRNLCDNNGKLTPEGKVVAISILPLKKQADILGLYINSIPDGYKGFPKIKVKNYMSNFFDYTNPDHYKAIVNSEILHSKIYPEIYVGNRLLELDDYNLACFDEGESIFILLSCMCYEEMRKAWKNSEHCLSINYSLNSITLLSLMENKKGFFENLSQKLINAVAKAQIVDVEKSFDKLKETGLELENENTSNKNCIGIDKSFITSLFKAIEKETLTGFTLHFVIIARSVSFFLSKCSNEYIYL